MPKDKTIVITREEIEASDPSRVAWLLAPRRLSQAELTGLCGAVRLRFAHAAGPEDLFLHPKARQFIRRLHRGWPWMGYFLRCKPITANSPSPAVIDVGVLVSWAFCHTDNLTFVRWDPDIVGMRFNQDQFAAAMADILDRTEQLCKTAGLSQAAARRRQKTIRASIASFFALGKRQRPKPDL